MRAVRKYAIWLGGLSGMAGVAGAQTPPDNSAYVQAAREAYANHCEAWMIGGGQEDLRRSALLQNDGYREPTAEETLPWPTAIPGHNLIRMMRILPEGTITINVFEGKADYCSVTLTAQTRDKSRAFTRAHADAVALIDQMLKDGPDLFRPLPPETTLIPLNGPDPYGPGVKGRQRASNPLYGQARDITVRGTESVQVAEMPSDTAEPLLRYHATWSVMLEHLGPDSQPSELYYVLESYYRQKPRDIPHGDALTAASPP
ncbi:hypothetical protein PbB2_01243 [Candidatus Phycosocius bacilliformis]|uniref:Uncharacterized protein n=1 Tax=Candidatus Phycosocius bacilliformis TaxID=1445552 RepID=A0A2P2E926_9PROT|nr:hypothetical protein [Candidatus Phycosocius bacilliformis]GBF57576.1 hypothetical protein PbB2_01243 [Candidatus Phycosocius bacilliformis]